MEYPVTYRKQTVGMVEVMPVGVHVVFSARCTYQTAEILRLYGVGKTPLPLGVMLPEQDGAWGTKRKISRRELQAAGYETHPEQYRLASGSETLEQGNCWEKGESGEGGERELSQMPQIDARPPAQEDLSSAAPDVDPAPEAQEDSSATPKENTSALPAADASPPEARTPSALDARSERKAPQEPQTKCMPQEKLRREMPIREEKTEMPLQTQQACKQQFEDCQAHPPNAAENRTATPIPNTAPSGENPLRRQTGRYEPRISCTMQAGGLLLTCPFRSDLPFCLASIFPLCHIERRRTRYIACVEASAKTVSSGLR